MKKNNTTKVITYFITNLIGFIIAFSIADNVTNFFEIKYDKFLSLGSALYIVIGTIVLMAFEFLISKIADKWSGRERTSKE